MDLDFDYRMEEDGYFVLEWYADKDNMLSIAIGTDNRLAYSGLIDGFTIYGTGKEEETPATIHEMLKQLKNNDH